MGRARGEWRQVSDAPFVSLFEKRRAHLATLLILRLPLILQDSFVLRLSLCNVCVPFRLGTPS